jgi:nucleoid DNA-binding protein
MSLSTRDVTPAPRDNVLEFATLVEALAQQQKLGESQVRAILRQLFSLTAEGLRAGKSVRIRGLGMLRIREPAADVPAREGRSARSARRRIVVSAEKALKVALDL